MTITDEVIHKYSNGGYRVKLFSDGTKIREQISKVPPEFPESMDIKITDYCDLSDFCKWCHEGSSKKGNHGDLSKLKDSFLGLPSGVELAIGGGNPLVHPDLKEFLFWCKGKGLVANITINELHIRSNRKLIVELVKEDLVKGIGITYSGNEELSWLHSLTDNVVYHVIVGVHHYSCIEKLPKVLVLGYKQIRKGVSFYSQEVSDNTLLWYRSIRKYLGKNVVSFDNLAIEQLNIKRFLTSSGWDNFYMGDDGTFTFYIDAVKEEFATSSISTDRYEIGNQKVNEMFLNIFKKGEKLK